MIRQFAFMVFALALITVASKCVTAQVAGSASAGAVTAGQAADCPPDSTRVGPACIDKYEASIWQITDPRVVRAVVDGTVSLKQLLKSGAIQRGVSGDDYDAASCPDTGNGCTNLYAVSIPGVTPSAFLTWFQATAALRNSGKRLPSNAEWQAAALGTPDGAPCIVTSLGPKPTGTPGGVSDVGVYDMVGNLNEWVADWVPVTASAGGTPLFPETDDETAVFGPSETAGPGVFLRGGWFSSGTGAGVFAITIPGPTGWGPATGFRGIR